MLPYFSLWGCWREQFLPDVAVEQVSHALVPKQILCGLFLVPTCPLRLSWSGSASGFSLKSDGGYLGWQQTFITKSKTLLVLSWQLCPACLHDDVFDVYGVFIWWATLGGAWWCFLSSFSPCEATPGMLCAALQHKRERDAIPEESPVKGH